ncbi:MAG: tetratricopeptide repeat protein [bacterium]|nr:tetratricopeptide repeat protein [bacterium]
MRRRANRVRAARFPLTCCLVVAILSGCASEPVPTLDEVRTLLAAGQVDESVEAMRAMIDAGDRSGETLFLYGRTLSRLGRAGQAVWALDEAMNLEDWVVPAGVALASSCNQWENWDLALATLARVRDERPDDPEEDLGTRLLEARVRLNTRRMNDEALSLLEGIVEDFPESEMARRMKAVAQLRVGDADAAYETILAAGLLGSGGTAEEGDPVAEAGEEAPGDPEDEGDGPALAAADPPRDGDAEGAESEAAAVAAAEIDAVDGEEYWCSVRISFKREAGDIAEAEEIASSCLEKFPESRGVLNEAIQLYAALGKNDRSLDVLKQAYDESPGDAQIRRAYVTYLTELGRVDDAADVIRSSIEYAKENASDGVVVAEATLEAEYGAFMIDLGRYEEGVEAYERSLELAGDLAAPDLLFRAADALIYLERYDDALDLARRTPVDVHREMVMGRVAFERRDYAGAIAYMTRAATLWPQNAPVRYYLARAAEGIGEFDEAVEHYRQAVRSDPSLAEARERLIALYMSEGRAREALTILNFNSPKGDSASSTRLHLLRVELQARLAIEPNLSLPRGLDMPIRDFQVAVAGALANGLAHVAGPAGAAATLAELVEAAEPSSRAPLIAQRIVRLLESGATTEAIEVARSAAARFPKDPTLRVAVGRALSQDDASQAEARVEFEAALEADEDAVDAVIGLGDLARRAGKANEAIAHYERALEIDDTRFAAAGPLSELLVERGDRAAAIEGLEDFVARVAPYDGRGARLLAELLGDDADAEREARLTAQADRFAAPPETLPLSST